MPGRVTPASSASGGPNVTVYDGVDASLLLSFFAYDPSFLGGVRVAAADANRDGVPDIVTGVGPGAGPAVRTFSGVDGGFIDQFFAYEPSFTGRIFVGGSGR